MRPARPVGPSAGGYLIAVDSVGAGAGETVLLLDEGNGARQVLGAPGAPIRTVVVGIVDAIIEDPALPDRVAETSAAPAEGRAAAGRPAARRAARRQR